MLRLVAVVRVVRGLNVQVYSRYTVRVQGNTRHCKAKCWVGFVDNRAYKNNAD